MHTASGGGKASSAHQSRTSRNGKKSYAVIKSCFDDGGYTLLYRERFKAD